MYKQYCGLNLPLKVTGDRWSVSGFTCGFLALLSLMYLLLQTAPAQALTLTTSDYYTDTALTTALTTQSHTSYGAQQTLYHKADGVVAAHKFEYTIDATGGQVDVTKSGDNIGFNANTSAEVTSYTLEWDYDSIDVDVSSVSNLFFKFGVDRNTDFSIAFYDDDDGSTAGYTFAPATYYASGSHTINIQVSALQSASNLDHTKIRRIVATFTPDATANKVGFDVDILDVSAESGSQLIASSAPEPGLPALAGAAILLLQAHRRRKHKTGIAKTADEDEAG